MSDVYIHYGSNHFEKEKFQQIENDIGSPINKPKGGLWACKLKGSHTSEWHDWCLSENFRLNKLKTSFIFELDSDANVFEITCDNDIMRLYEFNVINQGNIDWVKLRNLGYDAVYVELFSDNCFDIFYGWDCDSLLVLNPDCVIEI